MVDGNGIPLAVVVAGANRHDMKLVEATLAALMIVQLALDPDQTQHLCLDAGYDYDAVREVLAAWGYVGHIRSRSEEKTEQEQEPGKQARRWVVERTHSWLNRFRRLLIRWEKKQDNFVALLHFACAWITFRAAGYFEQPLFG